MLHIEKNVCDSIIGILLNIPGKTKDGVKSRLNLVEMGIHSRKHLSRKGKIRIYYQHVILYLEKRR